MRKCVRSPEDGAWRRRWSIKSTGDDYYLVGKDGAVRAQRRMGAHSQDSGEVSPALGTGT